MGNPDIGWIALGIFALPLIAGLIFMIVRTIKQFKAGEKMEAVMDFLVLFVLFLLIAAAIAAIFLS